jgi:hypothetical protein
MEPVFGNFSMSNTKKQWAIYDNESKRMYRRNGYHGGAGAVVTFKTREAAQRKINQLLNSKVSLDPQERR